MKRLILLILLLAACAAPAVEPAAEGANSDVVWTLRITFFDELDNSPIAAASVYVGDDLMCEETAVCEIEFSKAAEDEATIPLRVVADGYRELEAEMIDTLNESGVFLLAVSLLPIGENN